MRWCFGKVNNRLAEIYFDDDKLLESKIFGHCYIKQENYKTKKEQKMIEKDLKKVKVVYRNKKYKLVKVKD
ncbi:hypothetical protein KKH36_03375 [Patescibacteria group bacterium]|nr:hypothetical protein [Patescibacteria group bacterium]